MKKEIQDLIRTFKNLKVLVVGDAILDTYIKGVTDTICREAPVLVFKTQTEDNQCGGAANTAINVAALGGETYLLTVVGKDAGAHELVEVLRKNKVHTEYVIRDKTRKTVAKKRITASSNILLRVDEGTVTDISTACQQELSERVTELFPYIDVIILSDYGNGVITGSLLNTIKGLTASCFKPVIVDARELLRYKQISPTAIKPNYEEALKLLGISKAAPHERVKQILQQGKKIMELTGTRMAAVTLDTDGVLLFEKGKKPYAISCVPRDHKNAIGAGDTFTAALALAVACGGKSETGAEVAAAAAAIVVEKDETAPCSDNELIAYFNAVPKYIPGIEHLGSVVRQLKKQGKKIVFTNGCFDILHKGHITFLKKAREAGDVLIVGINNDESIRKLKGPGRPINNLEDRVAVLSGLQSVDYLIPFSEESPVRLIKMIHPDIFVKGGNYSESTIPEAALLKKLGCVLKIIPCGNDHSTTSIINRIRYIREEV